MMKFHFAWMGFFFYTLPAMAQQTVTGLWYSSDSTRIYQVYQENGEYKALLFASQRKNEQKGIPILCDVHLDSARQEYRGAIMAADDGLKRVVKIRLSHDGTQLKLRIPRFIIFPVTIIWYRAEY